MTPRSDAELWALSLVEALTEGNRVNVNAVLDEALRDDCYQLDELLFGMAALAQSLLLSGAASAGVTVAERVEVERLRLLTAEVAS